MNDEYIRELKASGRKIMIATQGWSRIPNNGGPGRGNHVLGEIALELARKHSLPIITQIEVADAIGHDECSFIVRGGGNDGMSTNDWNTFVVVDAQADWCRREKIDVVIVIAGPFHLGRSIWCWEKQEFKAFAGPQRKFREYQDSRLKHLQSRYPALLPLALAWELVGRILFVMQGRN